MNINSDILKSKLSLLLKKFSFINVQVVGHSVLGKPIYVVRLGHGPKSVFYSASFHANEWITSLVLIKFIEDYCFSFVNNSSLYGYSTRSLFNSSSIFIMPIVNPDGVDLVTGNIPVVNSAFQKAINIANDYPSIPFPDGWKANINGVDLKIYQPVCKAL